MFAIIMLKTIINKVNEKLSVDIFYQIIANKFFLQLAAFVSQIQIDRDYNMAHFNDRYLYDL